MEWGARRSRTTSRQGHKADGTARRMIKHRAWRLAPLPRTVEQGVAAAQTPYRDSSGRSTRRPMHERHLEFQGPRIPSQGLSTRHARHENSGARAQPLGRDATRDGTCASRPDQRERPRTAASPGCNLCTERRSWKAYLACGRDAGCRQRGARPEALQDQNAGATQEMPHAPFLDRRAASTRSIPRQDVGRSASERAAASAKAQISPSTIRRLLPSQTCPSAWPSVPGLPSAPGPKGKYSPPCPFTVRPPRGRRTPP